MKFEIGEIYQHTSGKRIIVQGTIQTLNHGRCTVVEDIDSGELLAADQLDDNTECWHTIHIPEIDDKYVEPSPTFILSDEGIEKIVEENHDKYSNELVIPKHVFKEAFEKWCMPEVRAFVD